MLAARVRALDWCQLQPSRGQARQSRASVFVFDDEGRVSDEPSWRCSMSLMWRFCTGRHVKTNITSVDVGGVAQRLLELVPVR